MVKEMSIVFILIILNDTLFRLGSTFHNTDRYACNDELNTGGLCDAIVNVY